MGMLPSLGHLARTSLTMVKPMLLSLAGIAAIAAGIVGMVSFALLPLVRLAGTLDWVPAEGTVEAVSVRPPRLAIHPPLVSLDVRYRYVHGGTEYRGERYDVQGGMFMAGAGHQQAAALRATPTVTVWLDPAAPGRALVDHGLRWHVALFALPAAGLIAAGAFLLYRGMADWPGGAAHRRAHAAEAR